MRGIRSKLRDESGAAIVLIALSMVALLSAVALAVDVGMLVTARTEAQRVSDLAALAGAGILAVNPDAEGAARAEAINFAALNTVQGDLAVVLPGDVDVNLDSSTVTVRMIRTQTRGTPVGTFFARVFGVNSVDIAATATAIAEPVGPGSGTNCLLPIMLPDRWSEDGTKPGLHYWPTADDSFDPPGSSIPGSKDTIPDGYDHEITGYTDDVIGDYMEIHKVGGGGGGINPSNYYPWTPLDADDQLIDGGAGAATYLWRFTNCMESTYLPGDSILTEPGAMVGPTNFGFDEIIASDAEMTWNNTEMCPWRPSKNGGAGGCEYTSSRIRPMPMFDPTEAPSNGRKVVHITAFGSVFIHGKKGNAYGAYWLGLIPAAPDLANDPVEGLPKYIHLIR